MRKEWDRCVEKKGVSGRGIARFCEVLEVAVNKRLRGFIGWVRGWWDAGRRSDSGAFTTKTA